MKTAARPEVARPLEGKSIPDERPDVTVVRPPGELDCSTGPDLVKRVGRLLRTTRTAAFEIPLDAVEFIDAAGMRSLVDCRKLVLRSRRTLTFTDASPVVRRLVALVGDPALPLDAPSEVAPLDEAPVEGR
jgi:anti-anti-sigma factor